MHVSLAAAHAGPATTSGRPQARQPPPTNGLRNRLLPCAAAARAGAAAAAGWRGVAAKAVADHQQQDEAAGAAVDAMIGQPGDADEWVEVGRIGPPHGVRGEMKVQALTDFPEDRLATAGPRCACVCLYESTSSLLCCFFLKPGSKEQTTETRDINHCMLHQCKPHCISGWPTRLTSFSNRLKVAASAGAQDWEAAGAAT